MTSSLNPSLNFTLYPRRRTLPWVDNDVRRLAKLCNQFLGANFSIEIVQLAEEGRRASRDGVVAAPAILVELPCGSRHNIGGFQEAEKYLRHLQQEPQFQDRPALTL
jgi:hypothetical protein